MKKEWLSRFMPTDETLREHPALRHIAHHINPNLWHFNQRSVALGAAVGLFFVFIPLPFHTFIAAFCAIMLRCNLPLAITTLWVVNNPLTMFPLYYFAYRVGLVLLGQAPENFHIEFTMEWLINDLEHIWEPFLIGALLCATTSAIAGNMFIRILWHCSVRRRWQIRSQRRRTMHSR